MSETQKLDQTFGITKKAGVIYLKGVRVQPFAAIYRPEVNLSGVEQYTVTCEITEEQYKFLKTQMEKAAQAKWKDKAQAMLGSIKDDHLGARKFSTKTGEFLGVRAARKTTDSKGNGIRPPKIMQRNKEPSTSESVDSIRPGDYVVLYIDPMAYDFNGQRGIRFDFVGAQYQQGGPSLMGRRDIDDDDFEDLADEGAEVPESW